MSGPEASNGKVAIVTGATKGIGLACAEEFAAAGYQLLICSRNQAEVEATAAGLTRANARVVGVSADLADEGVGASLVERCIQRFGQLDVLVNNAAIYIPTPMAEMTAEAWDRTLHTNLRGPALLASAAAQAMSPHTGAAIVNMTSLNGVVGEEDFGAYSASKAGVISLTQTMAIEYAAKGIRVNAVAPGWVRTPLSEPWLANLSQEEINRIIPMGRIGEPRDIATVVYFLASEGARYVTGQTIKVDGGTLSRHPVL